MLDSNSSLITDFELNLGLYIFCQEPPLFATKRVRKPDRKPDALTFVDSWNDVMFKRFLCSYISSIL